MPSRIKVTLVRSPIGLEKSQRLTAEALGLRRLQRSRVHHNNPQIRGMIRKIAHLVAIQEVPADMGEAARQTASAAPEARAELTSAV